MFNVAYPYAYTAVAGYMSIERAQIKFINEAKITHPEAKASERITIWKQAVEEAKKDISFLAENGISL